MKQYFDAHLYLANWGTRALADFLRLDDGLLGAAAARSDSLPGAGH